MAAGLWLKTGDRDVRNTANAGNNRQTIRINLRFY